MASKEAYEELNRRAAKRLVKAHQELDDDHLVLAIRYNHDDEDLYLFEVLQNFPGDDDDEPFETEYKRSPDLLIIGSLHLMLASPAQLRTAVEKNAPIVDKLKNGEVIGNDGSQEAKDLMQLLGPLNYRKK